MLKKKIKKFVKAHKIVYEMYYYFGTVTLKLIGYFVRSKEKTILFVSFGGGKFNDSPKALYDYICKNHYFDDYKLIWAFENPEKYILKRGTKVKIDSFKFFILALESKVWISNSAIERGLSFKKKNTLYINTWHGTPIKKIGTDALSTSKKIGLGSKKIYTQDIMTAQSTFDAEIFSRVFTIKSDDIIICDLPRNDFLINFDNLIIPILKRKLNIDNSKKIILYAPTFREYKNNNGMFPPINFDKWEKSLGDNYVVLFRAHYEISKNFKFDNDLFIDVSNYEDLNELMIISDILISDYSSIVFDYSLLEKPILCFAYDLDEYKARRGLYLDIQTELPCGIVFEEDALLQKITKMDYKEAVLKTVRFRDKYTSNKGRSSELVIQELIRRLDKNTCTDF